MSKDIKTYKDLQGKDVHLTSMWGGVKGKMSIQFTINRECFQLSEKQLLDLVKVINKRLEIKDSSSLINQKEIKRHPSTLKNVKLCKDSLKHSHQNKEVKDGS